ncbi:MAG: ACT domain-containing protein [Erysipelotrichaceae bacterium]|nr:ACT domain-containing protein [Erysipelotrichaceae bacterium]
MTNDMLVVSKELIPKYFEKVVETKKLLQEGKYASVSEACEKCGISRSTFYKYQNFVFSYEEEKVVKKLVLSFTLEHKTGSLSKVCDCFSKLHASIITITQSVPVGSIAPVMVTLDISNTRISLEEFKKEVHDIPEVHQLKVISIE